MFKRKSARKSAPARTLKHLFHGIAVVPGARVCDAAGEIEGRRFLSEDAPRLPLDACTCVRDCTCVYRHYSDRRTDVRRDADMGLPRRHVTGDKREGVGRRVTDV